MDTCLIFSNESISSIEKHLNVDFNNLCEWFIDNKLSIRLWKDKTKCVLFKNGKKQYPALDITRNENNIKHYSVEEYLGCLLDENMPGHFMAKFALKKINGKTKFIYMHSRYLLYPLKRMLCNSLIQTHFDFACCAWYLDLSMSLKNKLQTAEVPLLH